MKTKVFILSFGLFVVVTGSVITIEDWQQLSTVERIELIMTADELGTEQKNLLLAVLQSEHDDDEMRGLAVDQAQASRLSAATASNFYERERWEQAARFFEKTEARLQRLVGYESSYEGLLRKYDNDDLVPEMRESMRRAVAKLNQDIEEERQELHNDLQEAFIAVGLAEKHRERGVVEKTSELVVDPPSNLSLLGIVSLVSGLLISVITAGKLVLDSRKTKLEIEMMKGKLSGNEK